MPLAASHGSMTGALGRLLLLWALCVPAAVLACEHPETGGAGATVSRVIDGDTILLEDGERVRLIGLDAPETGRRGRPDEPFAREAARHLETLVGLSGGEVIVVPGEESRDRYGRLLARVYTPRHGDLGAHLIENGLAFAVAIAPNTSGVECHFEAERRARAGRRGMWADPDAVIVRASALDRTGFAIVTGEVTEVRQRREDALLRLDDSLVIRIRAGGLDHDPGILLHRTVEVRGWVHPWADGERAITVNHPSVLAVIPPSVPDGI